MTDLRLGGLARLSTCDWPGELVATLFCQGCPWRCPYCHNTHLLSATAPAALTWNEAVAFLESRRGLLDGVVFSGGEPTLQTVLPDAIATVRSMGFKIGLHTAGPFPDRLERVLSLVDWVGFDVKAPFEDYDCLTGVTGSGDKARDSLIRLLAAGTQRDIRITADPAWADAGALERIGHDLAALGAEPPRVQAYRPNT
ncbi:anaerobic ribonucleoside-triphosphate reductase activating protein [Magnetospirillum molischianum]|uniref:Anaerobic ribonucleoside-triphosphate reductase activating protein n=1 Tax=Magnetospirillum molischianum DSM 120 TaxID=1150626 RepID=H8FXF1_MAGML|nr:anaerobic ribonucleoside-triphosphate reductase activating protein [Magnetospirillum molischianum]CCG43039.1 Anaerobic ribonucleoside-triphosphate reductase activating protein [Magnetospirillum molischianum DSM 120]